MKITLCFKIKYNKSKRILFKKLRTNPLYCPDYCIYRPAIITQLNDSCLFMMGHKTDKTVYIGKTLKLETKHFIHIDEITDPLGCYQINKINQEEEIQSACFNEIKVEGSQCEYVGIRFTVNKEILLCLTSNFSIICTQVINTKHRLVNAVRVSKGVIAIGYQNGKVDIWNVNVGRHEACYRRYSRPFLVGKFECLFGNGICSILSMAYISEGIIAIGTNDYVIEIWKILDKEDNFYPECICKLFGQRATAIGVDRDNSILYAGGRDGTIKCFHLDYSSNAKWFLRFVFWNKFEFDDDAENSDTGEYRYNVLVDYDEYDRINHRVPIRKQKKRYVANEKMKSAISKIFIMKNSEIVAIRVDQCSVTITNSKKNKEKLI